ncbi:armadillo-type protein [Hyaloraphidium curvatum]|nr:armadillo-type protein [Hyaloraphidium curvatum]
MDFGEALKAVAAASSQLQQPATRSHAEQVLLAFRRAPNVLPVCRYILDHTEDSGIQFQVGLAIREAAVREYALLGPEELDGLQSYLLGYVYERPTLEKYVRDTLFSCITVIIKRGWLDDSEEKRQAILHRITDLLNGDLYGKRLSLGLLHALLGEFSSEKSSSVGLTWDFHNRCKAAFEKEELRHVFDIALQVVRAALGSDSWWYPYADGQNLVGSALAALAACLSWDFSKKDTALGTTISKRPQEIDEVVGTPDFPETWRDVLVRPDVLDAFFTAYNKFSENEDFLGKCEECLIELSGLRGRVFGDEGSRKAYAEHFMKSMLPLLSSYIASSSTDRDDLGPVLLAQSQMIKRFLSTFKLPLLHDLPSFLPFLQHAGRLTEISLKNMVDMNEDTWDEEAFDELLATWSTLVSDTVSLELSSTDTGTTGVSFDPAAFLTVLRDVAVTMFTQYVDTRLQIATRNVDDDVLEGAYKDYDAYCDQLVSLSMLARLDSQHSISTIHGQLLARLNMLKQWFSAPNQDPMYLSAIHEHTHWLILICSFLLADTGRAEKPLLPDELLRLAAAEDGRSALSPETDSVGALAKLVFDVLDYTCVDPNDVRAHDLSPTVAETSMFFLSRWITTYLFIEASDYRNLPHTFIASYGRPDHGGGGGHVLEFILDIMLRTFRLWSAEPDVLIQAITVLESFSKNKFLENAALMSPKFRELVSFFLGNLANLPEDTHALLIETVARIVSGAPDENLRSTYLESLGQAIDKRLQQVLGRPDFQAVYQQPDVLSDVDSVLEMFTGLALAADPSNSKQIFKFCSGYLPSFVKLFNIYATRAEVIVVILQFYESFVRNQDFEQLTPEDKQLVYSSVIDILKVYAAHNAGKKSGVDRSSEDEAHQDVSAMLEILTNLMAAEFQGLAKDELSERKGAAAKAKEGSVDVADVVYYGVNIVLPLITDDMLKYPRLCRLYTHLTSDLLEFFPEKLAQLPPELLGSLLKTLNYGIESTLPEVAETTYAAITALAVYVKATESASPASVSFLLPHIDGLLQLVLNLLLLRDFDPELVDCAGEALLALVYCRHGTYTQMITSIVSPQPPAAQARLMGGFAKLGTAMERALARANPGDASGGLGIPNKAFGEYLRVFEAVLAEARGLLRVK